MRLFKAIFLCVAGLHAAVGWAVESWTPTASEMTSLPPFCKARFSEKSAEYKLWESTLGPDFGHTHHYCAAVNFMNRYYRARTSQDKRFNLNNARGDFQYMVTHASPTFSLMPDVHVNLGTVYMLSNQPGQAIVHFNKAIELDPRQPKAYNALADFYAQIKQKPKALEVVTEGLRHNPDTRSLQRRYVELGGKLPYPTPLEPKTTDAPADKPEEIAKPAEAPVAPVTPAATPDAPQPESSAPKIGSPKNPYCRFCPD